MAPSIQFGEADGRMTERAARFRDTCVAAGFGAEVVADIRAAQWHKFVGLTVNAALTSLTPVAAGWIAVSFWLGRRQAQLRERE